MRFNLKYFLLIFFSVFSDFLMAQVNVKLPAVTVTNMFSKNAINLSALPQDGKAKVIMITSQSSNDRNLIAKIGDNNTTGNIVPLYVISVTEKASSDIGESQKNLNLLSVAEYEEMQQYKLFFYADKQKSILKILKQQATPLIFFLDGANNIIFCYQNDDLTAKQVITLNNLIDNKQITAGSMLYFDDTWFPTTKDRASYYRTVKSAAGVFEVNDYYINGTRQMKGYFETVYPAYRSGEFSFYTKNGQLETQRTYKYNQLNGVYKTYDQDANVYSAANYKNDILQGDFTIYYENGNKYTSGISYDNGLFDGITKFYYPDGKLKATVNYKKNELAGEAVGYDENEKVVFKVMYKNAQIELSDKTMIVNNKNENMFEMSMDGFDAHQLFLGKELQIGFKIKLENKSPFYFYSYEKNQKDKYAPTKSANIYKNGYGFNYFVWNYDNELYRLQIYADKGPLIYELYFKNNKLAKGKTFYANGKQQIVYDISLNESLQFYNDKGEKLYLDQSGIEYFNFMKQFKENTLIKFINASEEDIKQFSTDKLNEYRYWPELTIKDFLVLNAKWLY